MEERKRGGGFASPVKSTPNLQAAAPDHMNGAPICSGSLRAYPSQQYPLYSSYQAAGTSQTPHLGSR